MSERIETVSEWIRAVADENHVQVEIGFSDTPDVHENYVRLAPEGAITLGFQLIREAYAIRGVEVDRIGIIINPEVEEEEPKAEELPS